MLGAQPRIPQSKRISDLELRAKELSKQVGYVSEMNRLCSQMVHLSGKMIALMDENTTGDRKFSDKVAEMDGMLHAKIQQCDAWLRENAPKLEKLTDQLGDRK